ncbi:alpha/beta hydrolase [Streptomyces hygroscopicus]|uniref:alpha/beta hydrolase n=1 Tax=Streptomyces hygroscopicus TaxID=1912 RepID=UPI0007DB170C|nr:alpha/beta hydrolase [Streptomyces sp. NBRC 109436]
MDYATLTALEPTEFEDAANGYQSSSNMAGQAREALERQIAAKMREALEGAAATAAYDQLRNLAENFHYVEVQCGLVSTALNALAFDLRSAKAKLDAAVKGAQAEKLTVNADGSVSYPPGGDEVDGKAPEGGKVTGSARADESGAPIDPGKDANDIAGALDRQAANQHPNPYFGRAVEYADRIVQAVKEATEADELWAPKLRALKADDDLVVSDEDWIDAAKDTSGVRSGAKDYLDHIKHPPEHGSPKDNAAWWKGLSQDEKDAYIALHPTAVGGMDGLPAVVRDEANRTRLDEMRAQYQQERDAIPPEPLVKYRTLNSGGYPVQVFTDEYARWYYKHKERRDHLDAALDGMDAIQERFDETGGKKHIPEAYLLGFDPEKNDGRVIMATGNPDTADHTAVYVPGTKTHIGSIGGDLDRGERLWAESNKLSPNSKVSTITWLGYDAPDAIPDARHDKYAAAAAPHLRQFLDGNRAAHEAATGGHAHTTVIGHSYGSTVIGDATKSHTSYDPHGGALPVDDIIAAGSPGMQVGHASDLGIGSDHVWAMKAGGMGGDDWWVREGGRTVGLGGDGNIPTDPEFGAHLIRSGVQGHGDYWDDETTALRNQAAVITGSHDKVEYD